jgi:hypothetical protein
MKPMAASPKDELRIKKLLFSCGLPHEDITPEHLHHFWVLKKQNLKETEPDHSLCLLDWTKLLNPLFNRRSDGIPDISDFLHLILPCSGYSRRVREIPMQSFC